MAASSSSTISVGGGGGSGGGGREERGGEEGVRRDCNLTHTQKYPKTNIFRLRQPSMVH